MQGLHKQGPLFGPSSTPGALSPFPLMSFRSLLYFSATLSCWLVAADAFAQSYGAVRGTVRAADTGRPLPFATVRVVEAPALGAVADSLGHFEIRQVTTGPKHLEITAVGYGTRQYDVLIATTVAAGVEVLLRPVPTLLGEAVVQADRLALVAPGRLTDVSGTAIYAGRKTEVVQIEGLQANLATNNARQVLARVPGLNVIENDNVGISLSVAVRGLNPNRISEFNARQNGYDIAADPLGYPESYYTPPTEALERIEVVRGAASLQYGPQFGGLLNFVLKAPPTDRRIGLTVRQTVGSFGLANTYARAAGTVGQVSYTALGVFKRADGWRANSGAAQGTGFTSVRWQATPRLTLTAELTAMRYQQQQPGGRTDAEFAADPRGSSRDRNWFSANWLLPALLADYQLTDRTRLNVRAYGLGASRSSLGNLTPINQPDTIAARALLIDEYRNLGLEARLLHRYQLGEHVNGDLLVGLRAFQGRTTRRQGNGADLNGTSADFTFQNPNNLENFDYRFPSRNFAAFAENRFLLTPRLSLTPGIRVEAIQTGADGYYQFNGQRLTDSRTRPRTFPLLGLSAGYLLTETTDFYASFAQNYAAVNFNDLRVANPNFQVDPNLKDSRGLSAEAGYRGTWRGIVSFDVGAFWLSYRDRIGVLSNTRTNVADSRSVGAETFVEVHPLRAAHCPATWGDVAVFATYGFTDARYVRAENRAIEGKTVELAPRHILRSGLTYKVGGFAVTGQGAYTSRQFTEATNAPTPNAAATTGPIPAYTVADLSTTYAWAWVTAGAGCTNLLDRRYFTRRATGYPGPGILPSDGRAFYISLEVKL